MKKILPVVAAILTAAMLISCDQQVPETAEDTNSQQESTKTEQPDTTQKETEETEKEAEKSPATEVKPNPEENNKVSEDDPFKGNSYLKEDFVYSPAYKLIFGNDGTVTTEEQFSETKLVPYFKYNYTYNSNTKELTREPIAMSNFASNMFLGIPAQVPEEEEIVFLTFSELEALIKEASHDDDDYQEGLERLRNFELPITDRVEIVNNKLKLWYDYEYYTELPANLNNLDLRTADNLYVLLTHGDSDDLIIQEEERYTINSITENTMTVEVEGGEYTLSYTAKCEDGVISVTFTGKEAEIPDETLKTICGKTLTTINLAIFEKI